MERGVGPRFTWRLVDKLLMGSDRRGKLSWNARRCLGAGRCFVDRVPTGLHEKADDIAASFPEQHGDEPRYFFALLCRNPRPVGKSAALSGRVHSMKRFVREVARRNGYTLREAPECNLAARRWP